MDRPTEQDVKLTTILVCQNRGQLALAQGILDSAGIPYSLHSRLWGPISNARVPYATAFDLDGEFTVQVDSRQAAEASDLIAHLR
jgi:hypothetical protein